MLNFDTTTKVSIKGYNPIFLNIPDHPYRILSIGGSGSRKQMHCLIYP